MPTRTATAHCRISGLRLCISASGAPFMDGYILTCVGLVLIQAESQLNISSWLIGLIAFAYLLGSLCGSLVGGKLGDKYGRLPFFRSAPFILLLLSFGQLAFLEPMGLMISRFVFGLTTGVDSPNSQALLAENSLPKKRAKYLTCMMNAWFLGAIVAAITGWICSSFAIDWRFLAASSAFYALIFAVMRWRIPESVPWLKFHGQEQKARLSLYSLGLRDFAELELHAETSVKRTLSAKDWGNLTFLSVFWFCQAAPVTAVLMFGPLLLSDIGSLSSQSQDYSGTILADVFFLFGSLAAFSFIRTCPRRPLILWTFALMVVGFLAISFGSKLSVWLILPALIIYSLAYGTQAVLDYVYPSELFSTPVRSTALGILGSTSRIGSLICALLFPVGLQLYGQQTMCLIGCLILAFGLVVSFFFAPETLKSKN